MIYEKFAVYMEVKKENKECQYCFDCWDCIDDPLEGFKIRLKKNLHHHEFVACDECKDVIAVGRYEDED